MDFVEPAIGLGFDSALKVLEVTAQEIVDRINKPYDDRVDGDKEEEPLEKVPSIGSTVLDTEAELKKDLSETKLKNNPSQIKIVDEKFPSPVASAKNSSEKFTSVGPSPSTSKTDQRDLVQPARNERVGEVLTDLQKWIQEVQAFKGKGRDLSLGGGLANNLYYLYSIESFLRDLDWPSQKVLSKKFSSQLTHWLKELFNFRNASEHELEYNAILPHWDADEGMLAVAKWNLHSNFPNLLQTGYETFQKEERYPMIYCSDEAVAERIVASLGVSKSWVSLINTTDADWVSKLEQRILEDSKANRTPTTLLLNTDVKNLEKGCRLAEVYKVWVYLYGRNTFSYLVKRPETEQIAHSFTIELNKWVNSPPLPYLTVFKKQVASAEDSRRLELSGLVSPSKNLLCFTPWFCSQVYDKDKTKTLVEEVCERGQFLLTMLKKYPDCLGIVPNWSTLTDGQVIVSSLTFRYKPKSTKSSDEEAKDSTDRHVEFEQPSAQYVDTLNSWLYHIMERDLKSCIPVEYVYVKEAGWNVLFDVLQIHTDKFKVEDEETIQSIFDTHMTVLQCTVRKKMEFCKLVKETAELEWIDYETQWAGLGAVRYIPKYYRPSETESEELSDVGSNRKAAQKHSLVERKSNINHVNAQIVEKLKSIDNAFSLGEDPDGDLCVQFGMVTNETEVKELVRLVTSSGEEIEENSEFFHQMSEMIKKGIQKATEELKRESDEALWEEGILRHVPVVGTFMNWWSPPVKESGVRGRALNLAQGSVESTENIYKYHMQIESPSPSPSSANILNKINSSTNVRK